MTEREERKTEDTQSAFSKFQHTATNQLEDLKKNGRSAVDMASDGSTVGHVLIVFLTHVPLASGQRFASRSVPCQRYSDLGPLAWQGCAYFAERLLTSIWA